MFRFLTWCFLLAGLQIALTVPLAGKKVSLKKQSREMVDLLIAQAIDALQVKDKLARQQAFEKTARQFFDLKSMGDFIIGSYGRGASSEILKRYRARTTSYFAMLYISKFDAYGKGLAKENFTIGRSFAMRPERAKSVWVVKTAMKKSQSEPPIQMDWYLYPRDSGFKVIDVYIEGVSFTQTKRDEFKRILADEGLSGLVQKLEEHLQKDGLLS